MTQGLLNSEILPSLGARGPVCEGASATQLGPASLAGGAVAEGTSPVEPPVSDTNILLLRLDAYASESQQSALLM